MAETNPCLEAVQKAVGRELTTKEQKEVSEVVQDLLDRFGKEAQADGFQESVMKAVDELIADTEAAAIIEKRNAALNAKAKIGMQDYLKTVWKDDPTEGLKAVLGNSLADRQGSRNGVTAHIDSLAHNYVSGMTAKLAKGGVLDLAASGKLDDQIWKAMSELSRKTPDESILATVTPEAKEIAKVFNEYNELSRNHANQAGAWIKKLEGYVLRRSHDTVKIKKAAGMMIKNGDPRHAKAWKDFVAERIDWEKTMSDVPMARRDQVLGELYTQFAAGVHVKFGEGGVAGLKGFANIGKKLSRERVLHFKTPQAEFEYHTKFAQGGSIFENMTTGLMRMARDTAVMRKLGPNAKANYDAAIAEMKKTYVKEGNEAKVLEINQTESKLNRDLWPVITGEINIPENAGMAKWSQTIRNVEIMGDLARAVLSGLSDIPFYASAMRYTGERNFGSFLNGMHDAVTNLVKGVGSKTTPDQIQMASEMGILIDAVASPASHVDVDTTAAGRTSAWVQKFFKYNGLSWWQDKIRMGSVMATAHRHAQYAGKGFNELPSGMQAILRQFDIKPKEWDFIRSLEIDTDSQGRTFLTPEVINKADSTKIQEFLGDGKKMTPAKGERLKSELLNKYRTLFSEVAAMATSEPGKMERAIMMHGTRPGTWLGETLRHFWMYKSFTTSVMRKHLGRELWGYDSNKVSIAEALGRMVKGKNNSGAGGLANMIVFGTMMGYGSMVLKDLASGKTPRVPKDRDSALRIMGAAMAQSGSMGIYGDFLFGELKSRMGQGPLETFLGPTYKRISDITDLYQRVRSGDDFGSKAFNFALNNAPVANSAYNLFYTRWALDYLIVYRMQEMMNPGYLQRMQNRLKREKQQEFLVPPSKVIPYGGK